MNSILKSSLQAIGVGILTMAIGAMIIKSMQPTQPLKPLLLPLFLVGVALFVVIELTGMHRKFCVDYLKS